MEKYNKYFYFKMGFFVMQLIKINNFVSFFFSKNVFYFTISSMKSIVIVQGNFFFLEVSHKTAF